MNIYTLVSENFALILSTLVSLVGVYAVIRQTSLQTKSNITVKYIDMCYEAYTGLLDAIASCNNGVVLGGDVFNNLVFHANRAMMLSNPVTSEVISDFCIVYEELINAEANNDDTTKLMAEFIKSRKCLTYVLNKEMNRFDLTSCKDLNQLIRKRKIKSFLKAFNQVNNGYDD